MLKNTRFIVFVCAAAIALLLLLQFYWIGNYYKVNQATFEKEVNMAFEDALKKEFSLRCDTIQHLIANRLMDTAEFKLSSEHNLRQKRYVYTISNVHNPRDKFMSSSSFSHRGLNKPLTITDTTFKKAVAEQFAYTMRAEDLENHIVYYRTQNLGGFMVASIYKYDFDTTRLRPVLNRYLRERNISVPFKFYVRDVDSTLNRTNFNPVLLAKYPIITKSYPTYKQKGHQQYVRAMFTNPFTYIIARMGLMFAGSLLLVAIVASCMIWLLRMLFDEKRLSNIKNDFISNISHELKTPIATVSAAVEAMADFDVLKDSEKTKRYFNHTRNEMQRLAALVDKVLDSTIYENGGFDINPERLFVDEVLHNIIGQYQYNESKKAVIKYQNQSGIVMIAADRLYFMQVISNVIDNAIKYSVGDVMIEISCAVKNKFFVICIKDNGLGISKENIPYIFEKFYRVPSGNKHLVKGYGLGLNYVKSMIERHQGWCKMESEPGRGSRMILGWPI